MLFKIEYKRNFRSPQIIDVFLKADENSYSLTNAIESSLLFKINTKRRFIVRYQQVICHL